MASEDVQDSCSSSSLQPYESQQETSYTYIRILGRGAFGEAVLYRRTEDNSLVVWKDVYLMRLSDKGKRDAQNEIDILAWLNHANIVTYYNHFLVEDSLLIEMEYANGGNLHDKILHQEYLFPEETVHWYMYQLASAVAHIHDYGILHRDLKTLNIFLTKLGLIKLGDFGISKVLDSKSQLADSFVGTPYYMSPEIVQGVKYNYKSDIWALGCVFYELLTLTKTFYATNPLKLANEIVSGEFGEIDAQYTSCLRQLVKDMLKKDPDDRPSAEEILNQVIFTSTKADMEMKVWQLNAVARRVRMSANSLIDTVPVVTSKTSDVYQWGGGKQTPQKLDMFTLGKSAMQVVAGHSHFVVVTIEKELYTWANVQGSTQVVGQLGHGDTACYKAPRKVHALEGIHFREAACGEDFTLCLTDDGEVYAFGSDYYGCLGCDNEEGDEVLSPIPVSFFSNNPVEEIACGDAHVIALTKQGEVYTWGCGEFGRLGLGSEDDFATPQKVEMRARHKICGVCAGRDGSFLLTKSGRVLACGSNEHNKLGFNSSAAGLRKTKKKISYDIPCKKTFTPVKPLCRRHVVSVATGHSHSAVIDLFGHLYTFGSNKFGQLGLGDYKQRDGVNRVAGALTGRKVDKVSCGDGFTVAATNDNEIYSFGNGDLGRLGCMSGEQGKGPNGRCTALPKAIFGSLHMVSNLSSRHWHTILVAEKVINQKTLKTRVSSPKTLSSLRTSPEMDIACTEDEEQPDIVDPALTGFVLRQFSDESLVPAAKTKQLSPPITPGTPPISAGCRSLLKVQENSTVPGWLKAELDGAEYIPLRGSQQEDNADAVCEDGDSQPISVPTNHSTPNTMQADENTTDPKLPMPEDPVNFSSLPIKSDVEKPQPTKPQNSIDGGARKTDTNSDEIETLKQRIVELESENTKLHQVVASHSSRLAALEAQLQQ